MVWGWRWVLCIRYIFVFPNARFKHTDTSIHLNWFSIPFCYFFYLYSPDKFYLLVRTRYPKSGNITFNSVRKILSNRILLERKKFKRKRWGNSTQKNDAENGKPFRIRTTKMSRYLSAEFYLTLALSTDNTVIHIRQITMNT